MSDNTPIQSGEWGRARDRLQRLTSEAQRQSRLAAVLDAAVRALDTGGSATGTAKTEPDPPQAA
jgi:hypothetical protein